MCARIARTGKFARPSGARLWPLGPMAGRVLHPFSVCVLRGQAKPWHTSPKVCARIARSGKFARQPAARKAGRTWTRGGPRIASL